MILEKIRGIIVNTLACSEDEVREDSLLMEDLGADSLDAVELSMALEDEFGLSIADDEFKDLKTVKDIVDYIKKRI